MVILMCVHTYTLFPDRDRLIMYLWESGKQVLYYMAGLHAATYIARLFSIQDFNCAMPSTGNSSKNLSDVAHNTAQIFSLTLICKYFDP